jgi:hypothetical protein
VIGVEALGKPAGQRCQHECASGCAIYENRPAECRNYNCLWRLGFLKGDERRRPDNIGVIFDLRSDNVVAAWETRPGAMDEPNADWLLRRMGEQVNLVVHRYAQLRSDIVAAG